MDKTTDSGKACDDWRLESGLKNTKIYPVFFFFFGTTLLPEQPTGNTKKVSIGKIIFIRRLLV